MRVQSTQTPLYTDTPCAFESGKNGASLDLCRTMSSHHEFKKRCDGCPSPYHARSIPAPASQVLPAVRTPARLTPAVVAMAKFTDMRRISAVSATLRQSSGAKGTAHDSPKEPVQKTADTPSAPVAAKPVNPDVIEDEAPSTNVQVINEQLVQEGVEKVKSLLPSQFRVFRELASGRKEKQMAANLNLEESTVISMLPAIYQRLGIFELEKDARRLHATAIWDRYAEKYGTDMPAKTVPVTQAKKDAAAPKPEAGSAASTASWEPLLSRYLAAKKAGSHRTFSLRELSRGVGEMLEAGVLKKDIEQFFGESYGWVSRLISFTRITDPAWEIIEHGDPASVSRRWTMGRLNSIASREPLKQAEYVTWLAAEESSMAMRAGVTGIYSIRRYLGVLNRVLTIAEEKGVTLSGDSPELNAMRSLVTGLRDEFENLVKRFAPPATGGQ